MAIKIPLKKKVLSNKAETPGKSTPQTGNQCNGNTQVHKGTPIPFIDRLSVVLTIPNEQEGYDIRNSVWTAVKNDKENVHRVRSQGEYQLAARLAAGSAIDFKKRPYFQMAEDGKCATKLRIDFVPVDLTSDSHGIDGLGELHAILATLMPNGWNYFVTHGNITRLDVAVDFPAQTMDDFHFFPKQGATTTIWKVSGKLGTFQHGLVNGNHTSIYDREAKRKAQKKAWQGKTGIRVERRLKSKVGKLKDLASLPNPFTAFKLVEKVNGYPPPGTKPFVWELFLHAADLKGLPTALAMLPEDLRTVFRKHYEHCLQPWWDANAIWAQWPESLNKLKLVGPNSWS